MAIRTNAFATSFAPMLKVYTNPKIPPAMAIHRYSCNVPLILLCRKVILFVYDEHWMCVESKSKGTSEREVRGGVRFSF